MLQVVKNSLTLFVEYPFVHRYSIHVSEQAPEGSNGISAQMGEFFYILYLIIILHDEVLETFSIRTDGIKKLLSWGRG